jgi:hypothetical protein
MNGYSVALFVHLLSLLLASVAASLSTFAALRLRRVDEAAEAKAWVAFVGRVVPAFPLAVVGLLGSGIYMTHERWGWSIPWVDAALVGLGLIVALGSGVEGARTRALGRELEVAGMSSRARRLLRDPLAWSAKMTTLTVAIAVVFVMTVKPAATECVAVLSVAVAAGVLAATPLWRVPAREVSEATEPASS